MRETENIPIEQLRQGDIVVQENTNSLIASSIDRKPEITSTDIAIIVISQDCDIISSKEQYIELIAGFISSQEQKMIQNRKNPRKLQISFLSNLIVLDINDRFRIKKTIFPTLNISSNKINDQNLFILRRWLADRYKRPAFPNEFNNRLNKQGKKLISFYKKNSTISMILVKTEDDELPEKVLYHAEVILVYPTLPVEEIQITGEFEEILMKCNIEATVEPMPEDDVTLPILKKYKCLSLDHLSLNGEPSSPDVSELG